MIRQCDIREVPGRSVRYNNFVEPEVREFMASEWPCCEVETNKYKTAECARSSYNKAIVRLGYKKDVYVVVRRGRVFMIRAERVS